MKKKLSELPLSMYIHFPWCLRKCPYCDFISYPQSRNFSQVEEDTYVSAMLRNLEYDWLRCTGEKYKIEDNSANKLISIYFGGGTPSLLSLKSIARILAEIKLYYSFSENIEISIEANPGTLSASYCEGLLACGINRISIGAQSFQNEKLITIGRLHDAMMIEKSFNMVRAAGFLNINLDLMFGLPGQSCDDALFDLQKAIDLNPTHISWYQFTIEPNTIFARQLPVIPLPDDEQLWAIQQGGQQLLTEYGFKQYEISAYGKAGFQCQHNLNYWQFGDYLGMGVAAHGKLTFSDDNNKHQIIRYSQVKTPQQYCQIYSADNSILNKQFSGESIIAMTNLPFEFMLNALRLHQAIPFQLFIKRTGLPISSISKQLQRAVELDLLQLTTDSMITTAKGKNFLNDLLEIFM